MNSSACDDWVEFKEEKCIKVFASNSLQTYEDVKKICSGQGSASSMININSVEEQKFMEQLLFDQNKIVDYIWLGAKRDPQTKEFKWNDGKGSKMSYENWLKIDNRSDYDCVDMISDEEFKGKWINTNCNKKNVVVCEKLSHGNSRDF